MVTRREKDKWGRVVFILSGHRIYLGLIKDGPEKGKKYYIDMD